MSKEVKKTNLEESKKKPTTKKTSTTKKTTSGKHVSKDTGKKVVKKDIKEAKHVKQDNKKKNIIIIIFLIVCLCGLGYSGYKIYEWNKNLNENRDIQEDLNDKISEEDGVYHIDFDALKAINPDTVAYLDYKQFNVNYVIVKGKDNSYYLDHNFNRQYNGAGWVFADYRNKFDGTDKNIVMFGHSMKNGSMFGSLHKILNDKNYEKEENQTMTFVTPDGTYKYRLFAVYTVDAEDYYITTEFKKKKDWTEFVKKAKSRSIYKYDVEVGEDDTIITLSTCQGYTGTKRMVIQAVRVKE